MAAYYYLISSLPMLRYGEPVPFPVDEFLANCAPWLDPESYARLEELGLLPDVVDALSPDSAVYRWYVWETGLRNRLVRQRASVMDRDPSGIVRADMDCFSEIDRGVQDAYASANPLDRERILDRLRWRRLDDLESGHLFDFDFLCIYKIKLLINAKWAVRDLASGKMNLDESIRRIVEAGGPIPGVSGNPVPA